MIDRLVAALMKRLWRDRMWIVAVLPWDGFQDLYHRVQGYDEALELYEKLSENAVTASLAPELFGTDAGLL